MACSAGVVPVSAVRQDPVRYVRPAIPPVPPLTPCPSAALAGQEGPAFDPTHPAAGCPSPGGVACPHVSDTTAADTALPACTPSGQLTTQQVALWPRWQPETSTEGIRRRLKYETLPDHLADLAFSEILSSDRFKSTAMESFTAKSRDRCLNPEPIFSPAPPCRDVGYLNETEERVKHSTLPASKARFSEYAEAYHPKRAAYSDLVAHVKLKRTNQLLPSTDILPKHFYTARDGVAGEVNPYLSTTRKDFKPIAAETVRKYRDKPSDDTFSGDAILSAEAVPMPRWHGFTPTVPNTGLQTEAQARYCRPRLDERSRYNWTLPVQTPLCVPPTTRQVLAEPPHGCESDNYGSGSHNQVALSCRGLMTEQRHRRQLCNVVYDEPQPGRPACSQTGPLSTAGYPAEPDSDTSRRQASISDHHFGITSPATTAGKPVAN